MSRSSMSEEGLREMARLAHAAQKALEAAVASLETCRRAGMRMRLDLGSEPLEVLIADTDKAARYLQIAGEKYHMDAYQLRKDKP